MKNSQHFFLRKRDPFYLFDRHLFPINIRWKKRAEGEGGNIYIRFSYFLNKFGIARERITENSNLKSMRKRKTFRNNPDVLRASFVRIFRLREGKKKNRVKRKREGKKMWASSWHMPSCQDSRSWPQIQNLWFPYFQFFFTLILESFKGVKLNSGRKLRGLNSEKRCFAGSNEDKSEYITSVQTFVLQHNLQTTLPMIISLWWANS